MSPATSANSCGAPGNAPNVPTSVPVGRNSPTAAGNNSNAAADRSTAPTSTVPLKTRAAPRWSVVNAAAAALSPPSRAGLPGRGMWVSVGPPLSASNPSRGSSGAAAVPIRFPWVPLLIPWIGNPNPMRLLMLAASTHPAKSSGVVVPLPRKLPATSVFRRVTVFMYPT